MVSGTISSLSIWTSNATSEDHALKGLRAAIRFNSCKDDNTIGKSNIILRWTRIVIPNSPQQKAIDLAHESHQGLSKTKALLREKVWFPAIDEMVKKTIDSCIACQAVGQAAPPVKTFAYLSLVLRIVVGVPEKSQEKESF